MKAEALALVIAILATALFAGCVAGSSKSGDTSIAIIADRSAYTPLMSSTVGIGLTPEYASSIDNDTASFRWHADYGHFILWNAPGYKVDEKRQDVTASDGKIYWSYDPDDMGKIKPPVRITLTMIDKASGAVIGNTSLAIGWENRDYAVVKP